MSKLSVLATLALAFTGACGDDPATTPHDAPVHADAGPDAAGGPDASCFTNPQTYNQIINACTSAQKIYKDSHPPLLNADGSLPVLPP